MPNGKKLKAVTVRKRPPANVKRKSRIKIELPQLRTTRLARMYRTDLPATPKIKTPTSGYIPPWTDVSVMVDTNRSDLGYKLELYDLTSGASVFVFDFKPPDPDKQFIAIFDWFLIEAERDYQIRVWVDPAYGETPPNEDDVVLVTTKSAYAVPVQWIEWV